MTVKSAFYTKSTVLAALQVAGKRHNLLVAASTSQMMVYDSERLVWAAKGPTCPVAIKAATFAGQQGDSLGCIQNSNAVNVARALCGEVHKQATGMYAAR